MRCKFIGGRLDGYVLNVNDNLNQVHDVSGLYVRHIFRKPEGDTEVFIINTMSLDEAMEKLK